MLEKIQRTINLFLRFLTAGKERLNLSKLDLSHLDKTDKANWENRIADVVSCPDNHYIPRHEYAGKIINGNLVLHNGLMISPLSYCGYPMLRLFMENKGVHEPQEERVFQEILKELPDDSAMIELGSYWSFYSMWFKTVLKKSCCYMIEPNKSCLKLGKKNFRINSLQGKFFNYTIGHHHNKGVVPSISIDKFIEREQIDFIHILHSDIQGQEYNMLRGVEKSIQEMKIGYFIISTHSNKLHYQCKQFLERYKFVTVASADIDQTFSYDGLLVMKAPYFKGIDRVEISLKGSNSN